MLLGFRNQSKSRGGASGGDRRQLEKSLGTRDGPCFGPKNKGNEGVQGLKRRKGGVPVNREDCELSRVAYVVVGLVLAFGVGFLAASWRSGKMPWESSQRPAERPSKGPVGSSAPVDPLPSPPPEFPATGSLPQASVSSPARQGDLLFEQGRYQEAIPFYQKALEASPADVDTWNDLGLALFYVGRGEDSLEVLRQGAKLEPTFQRIWLSLGFVAMRLNRPQEAKTAWERTISIAPTTDIANEARKFLGELK